MTNDGDGYECCESNCLKYIDYLLQILKFKLINKPIESYNCVFDFCVLRKHKVNFTNV